MEIRAFPADAVVVATRRLRFDLRPQHDVHGLHRQRRQPLFLQPAPEVWQRRVHPGASHGHSRGRQAAFDERIRSRRRRPCLGPAHGRRSLARPREIPENERYYFLEERYPEYGNLVPRDIATREIFNICVNEGLSVEPDRQCVYLDLTHIPRHELDRKLGGILEIYEKFQGVDPRDDADEDFSGRALQHGRTCGSTTNVRPKAACKSGDPRNQITNIPGLYAIGECDYQYHGANRLGANSLLSCIFSG